MTRSLKGIMTAAALFAVAACGDAAPTEPSAFVPETEARMAKPSSGNFTFSVNQSYSDEQAFSATGGTGRINFAGSIFTGTPCYNVTGSSATGSGTVTVTVDAAPNGNACIQVITYNNYTGTVSGLAAGTYTFNIVHKRGTTTEVAYTTTVTVS